MAPSRKQATTSITTRPRSLARAMVDSSPAIVVSTDDSIRPEGALECADARNEGGELSTCDAYEVRASRGGTLLGAELREPPGGTVAVSPISVRAETRSPAAD